MDPIPKELPAPGQMPHLTFGTVQTIVSGGRIELDLTGYGKIKEVAVGVGGSLESGGSVLWRIRATNGSGVSVDGGRIVVGVTPVGFDEVVPFHGLPTTASRKGVTIAVTDSESHISFA